MKINVKKINTYTGHKDCIYSLAGGKEDHIFYSAGGEGYVVKWDLKDPKEGQLLAKVSASVYSLYYHHLHNILVVGQNNEGIYLIDLESKKTIGSLKMTQGAIFDIASVGNKLFVATGDGLLTIVDMERLSVDNKFKLSESSLRTLAIGNDPNYITIGASDNNIYVFDIQKGEAMRVIEGHKNSVFTVKYADPSSYLISAGRDAHLNFWNVADDYYLEASIPAHTYAINHVAFRQDFKYFATGSMDKTIKIWNYSQKKLVKVIDKARYDGHVSSVNKLYWSKFHNYLVSAGDDRSISVWDLELLD